MSTFEDLAFTRTTLRGVDLVHLRRLITDWGAVADLSFSDFLLLVPIRGEGGHRFAVLGQVRSTTGQTLYPSDMVGAVVDEVERPLVTRCFREGRALEGEAKPPGAEERVLLQCFPVRREDEMLGVLTREETLVPTRRPGEMERHYKDAFLAFAGMVGDGTFPYARETVEVEAAPRVSDGVMIVDADARITYASPNAVSSLHRLGIHAYTRGSLMREVGLDDTAVRTAMRARLPVDEEIERGEVSVLLRVLPLLERDAPAGAVVLMRDVTDLRRRDRMLMSKDATIREIHHRVKNNLQTIASLLRLQGRRLRSEEGRAALEESERRIRSIAIVHETLSQASADVVDFSAIVRSLVRVVEETVAGPDRRIDFSIVGDAGVLPGEVATPLAVVLNELMQNAVDHAFVDEAADGRVAVTLSREQASVVVVVHDDGVGVPAGFDLTTSKGLGLSIVQALVTGELGGTIEVVADGGTSVSVRVPVAMPRVEPGSR